MKQYQPNPYLLGFTVFIIQLALIVAIILPNKSLLEAWISLATHWDSEWYEAIAKYGYINLDGPHNTGLQNANVVFFPGYPILARILYKVFHIDAKVEILIISQSFCLCFWILVCKIIQKAKFHEKIAVILLIAFFPTSWFFYTGYSESTFTFTTILTLWLFTQKKWLTASFAAMFMTATRIIGTPVLIVPTLTTAIFARQKIIKAWQENQIHQIFNYLFKPSVIGIVGVLGVIAFLSYCQFKFGSWNLYFAMEKYGWNGEAYLFFLFKKSTWLPPPFAYNLDLAPPLPNIYGKILPSIFQLAAYTFSQVLVPIFMWLSLVYSYFIAKHWQSINKASLAYFLSALLILLFSCLSLYSRYYESMSRCLFPVWILLILSDITHPQKLMLFRLNTKNLWIIVGVFLVVGGGYWLEMLSRFDLNWWVA